MQINQGRRRARYSVQSTNSDISLIRTQPINDTISMTVYHLPNDRTFTKTIVQAGRGLQAPNEGSTCRVIVQFLSEPLENVSVDLLPLGEEKTLEVGFYSSIVGGYLHKCLLTMKEKEISHLSFHHSSQLVRLSLALLSFQRVAEIYSMSMTDLYTFALKHKENGNRFFQEKFFDHAFDLYHRSLSYLFNFVTEEPSSEHLDRSNRLALTIYSNMAACQLISGNSAGVIENCSSALQIDPNFSKALFRRACAYAQINDYELALTDLHAAQSLEPNDAKINEVLQETKQRFEHYRKNLGQALKNLF